MAASRVVQAVAPQPHQRKTQQQLLPRRALGEVAAQETGEGAEAPSEMAGAEADTAPELRCAKEMALT